LNPVTNGKGRKIKLVVVLWRLWVTRGSYPSDVGNLWVIHKATISTFWSSLVGHRFGDCGVENLEGYIVGECRPWI